MSALWNRRHEAHKLASYLEEKLNELAGPNVNIDLDSYAIEVYLGEIDYDFSMLGLKAREVLTIMGEGMRFIHEEFSDLPDEEKGVLVGVFVSLAIFVYLERQAEGLPVGVGPAIAVTKRAPYLTKLIKIDLSHDSRIEQLVNEIQKYEDAAERECFLAGTPVLTRTGFEEIENLRRGDVVFARCEATGHNGWREIEHTSYCHRDYIWRVVVQKESEGSEPETISVTDEHPFAVDISPGWEFRPVDQLRPGMTIKTAGGDSAVIKSMIRERAPPGKPFVAYNFSVSDYHTYFVGTHCLWTHNSIADCPHLRTLNDKYTWLMAHTRDIRLGDAGRNFPSQHDQLNTWVLLQAVAVRIHPPFGKRDGLKSPFGHSAAPEWTASRHKFWKGMFEALANDIGVDGLIELPNIQYKPDSDYWPKYSIAKNHEIQYHHWWPKELGGADKDGLVIPLATPYFHTGGKDAIHNMIKKHLRKSLNLPKNASWKNTVVPKFLALDFPDQKKKLKEFYEDFYKLRMPDFTDPGEI